MSKLSTLTLADCQIKGPDQFRSVCQAIDTLEINTFIRSGRIRFRNVFICPDIDLLVFYKSKNPTERLIAGLAIQLHVQKYRKHSRKAYRKIVNKTK